MSSYDGNEELECGSSIGAAVHNAYICNFDLCRFGM